MIDSVQVYLGVGKFVPKTFHGVDEWPDFGLANEAYSWFREGKSQAPPVVSKARLDRTQSADRFVARVDDLLAGRKEPDVSRVSRTHLLLLLGAQTAMNAPPMDNEMDGSGRTAQPVSRTFRSQWDIGNSECTHGTIPFTTTFG
jgi:hypothetical protein